MEAARKSKQGEKRKGAPAGGAKAAKKPRTMTLYKNIFDSPFHFTWPAVAQSDASTVMDVLTALLKEFKEFRERKRSTKKAERQALVAPALPRLACGLNAVTRALEKNDIALVVLCRRVHPAQVVQHVPMLCKLHGVPLCTLDVESKQLSNLIGMRTAIAIGLRRDDELVQHAVSQITSLCPKLNIPWLPNPQDSSLLVELKPPKYTRAEFTKIVY